MLLTHQEHPLPGATVTSDGRDTLRRLLLERFLYAVIVDVRPETRLVLAVAHLRRRPGYWRARVPKRSASAARSSWRGQADTVDGERDAR